MEIKGKLYITYGATAWQKRHTDLFHGVKHSNVEKHLAKRSNGNILSHQFIPIHKRK